MMFEKGTGGGICQATYQHAILHEFWYDYIKRKYGDKARIFYMDTDSFVMYIETEDFYKDIADDVERWFDTSNYDKNDKRPLSIGKNKKVIAMFKDELGGKIVIKFCALRAKAYSFLIDGSRDDDYEKNNIINKKAKGTKKSVITRELMFKSYKDSLFNDEVIIRLQQRFRSYHHKVYTEEVNKIALSSNDDKRIQTFDKVTTFPYGRNVFRVCEGEMLSKNKFIELDEDIGNTKTEDIVNTKTDVDNTKIEDINNNKPYIDKDTKPDIKRDSNPNIKIDKKTSLQVFKVVKFKFKNKNNWEKKVMTWAFWKSPVSELCEKWIYYNNNYAYTRFEENTCSGEVLFTNEHKAVSSKNKTKT